MPSSLTGRLGRVKLDMSIYGPVLSVLENYRIVAVGEIEASLRGSGITAEQIFQAIVMLSGIGVVQSAQEDEIIEASIKTSHALNQELIQRSRSNGNIPFLCSPVTGGGILVSRTSQLFLLAIYSGKETPEEWAELVSQYSRLSGQASYEASEIPAEKLMDQARDFSEKQLPMLKALRVI